MLPTIAVHAVNLQNQNFSNIHTQRRDATRASKLKLIVPQRTMLLIHKSRRRVLMNTDWLGVDYTEIRRILCDQSEAGCSPSSLLSLFQE